MSGDVLVGGEGAKIILHIVRNTHKRKVYKGFLPLISMVKQIEKIERFDGLKWIEMKGFWFRFYRWLYG